MRHSTDGQKYGPPAQGEVDLRRSARQADVGPEEFRQLTLVEVSRPIGPRGRQEGVRFEIGPCLNRWRVGGGSIAIGQVR